MPPADPVELGEAPSLLAALADAKAALIDGADLEAASTVGALEARVRALLGEVRRDLRLLDLMPSRAPSPAYGVFVLEGGIATWPEQLGALGREGWRLVTVVREDERYAGLFEPRA